MKNITANQRTINIFNKALSLGFEFNENQKIEEARHEAEEFLINNTEATQEECTITNNGHTQHLRWNDYMGFDYWEDGEIVDYSGHWYDAPDTRVVFSTVIDSEANVIDLYYLVGETDRNAPEGYYYDEKSKSHLLYTYDVVFNDENDSNNKGFMETFENCKSYIESNNGGNDSYFADYKSGTVSIVCNESGETVFETEII